MLLYDTPNLDTGITKVYEKTYFTISCLKIVQALSEVNIINILDCFQFHQNFICDKEIYCLVTDNYSIIHDGDWTLLFYG